MQAKEYPGGVWFPDVRPLHALRSTLPYWFPRVNEIIRLLGSHNVFAAPTLAQMRDPELKPLIDRYLRGAGDVSAEERVRVFRLGWDFVGSGARQPQRAVRALLPRLAAPQPGAPTLPSPTAAAPTGWSTASSPSHTSLLGARHSSGASCHTERGPPGPLKSMMRTRSGYPPT